jgi:hypothetical protein
MLTRDGGTLRRQTTLVQVPVLACFIIIIFFICFILTNTQLNCAVTHPLFKYTFQNLSLLHWQG